MEYLLLELHCFHGCLSLVKSESQTIYIRHVEENEEGLINNLDSFWKIVWKSKRSMQCAALTSFFFLAQISFDHRIIFVRDDWVNDDGDD